MPHPSKLVVDPRHAPCGRSWRRRARLNAVRQPRAAPQHLARLVRPTFGRASHGVSGVVRGGATRRYQGWATVATSR